jgi:hypothetical protein
MDRREAQAKARAQAQLLAEHGIKAIQAGEGLWIAVEEADKLLALLASPDSSTEEGS